MSIQINQQSTTCNLQHKKLFNKVKKFPLKPGVYQFIGKSGEILYVGRATLLRRRVAQYFVKSPNPLLERGAKPHPNPLLRKERELDPRISEMVKLAKDVKFIQTDSLLEAIILEANLIKKYWPKYNVKDRDDCSFIYIVIPKKGDFQKPVIMRGRALEKFINTNIRKSDFRIFGPYQSLALVKNALKIIRRIFPYSVCRPVARGTVRKITSPQPSPLKGEGAPKPCFDYQIGLCPGACVGAISKKDYQKNINELILFLKGDKRRLMNRLKKENPEKIKALQHVQDVALIKTDQQPTTDNQQPMRIEGYDISHLTGKETYGSMVVFSDGVADKEQYRLFKVKEAPAGDDLKSLGEVVTRRFKHLEWQFPDIIMIDGGRPQVNWVYKILKNLNINIPIVGISKYEKRKKSPSPFEKEARGDVLVFPPKTKNSFKELVYGIKRTLLQARDEAHRFALKSSRKKRDKNLI